MSPETLSTGSSVWTSHRNDIDAATCPNTGALLSEARITPARRRFGLIERRRLRSEGTDVNVKAAADPTASERRARILRLRSFRRVGRPTSRPHQAAGAVCIDLCRYDEVGPPLAASG